MWIYDKYIYIYISSISELRKTVCTFKSGSMQLLTYPRVETKHEVPDYYCYGKLRLSQDHFHWCSAFIKVFHSGALFAIKISAWLLLSSSSFCPIYLPNIITAPETKTLRALRPLMKSLRSVFPLYISGSHTTTLVSACFSHSQSGTIWLNWLTMSVWHYTRF